MTIGERGRGVFLAVQSKRDGAWNCPSFCSRLVLKKLGGLEGTKNSICVTVAWENAVFTA